MHFEYLMVGIKHNFMKVLW